MSLRTSRIGSLDAPVVAMGSWAIGGDGWGGSDRKEAIEALREGIANGMRLIDTAPIYGFGLSEDVVGEAIQGYRDEVLLATKCGLRWNVEVGEFNYEDGAGNKIYRCLSPESIREEVEASLKRLKVDTIDLYQTHWQTHTTPIEDTMAALMALKEEGKIREIGVSNVTPSDVLKYESKGPVASVQEMFSMIDREKEADLFPFAIEKGVGVLAYSPLAMGLLSGKLGPERVFNSDDNRSWSPRFTVANRYKVKALLDDLEPIASDNALSLAQLVLAWTVAQPTVTHILCGCRTVKQAKENAKGGFFEFSEADLKAIDEVIARHALKLPHPFLPED
ncbi:aldo/keto reductase [Pelagicoccus albus]|uniref:Aldo/keto reductase n=2 Tax=Pelagicoccus albus TaxID=415222 RepID=A0A7X1B8G0_9BACT|nr:aldo/keto reductase [Pelagicoccus albus]